MSLLARGPLATATPVYYFIVTINTRDWSIPYLIDQSHVLRLLLFNWLVSMGFMIRFKGALCDGLTKEVSQRRHFVKCTSIANSKLKRRRRKANYSVQGLACGESASHMVNRARTCE
jgi:hypothetical protein